MSVLVLSPRRTPAIEAIQAAALSSGVEVERLSGWRAPDRLRGQRIAVYGEPLFCAVVAQTLDHVLLEPSFDWLATVPREHLLREVEFTTLAAARAGSGRAFIKPCDDKCFAARVYDDLSELPATEDVADATPVLVSEPVRWTVEFRSFVLDRRVATLSPYSRDGELCQDEDGEWPASEEEHAGAVEFLNALLSDSRVDLPPAVVVDVGMIDGAGWAVVEANACWGAGIYGCDPSQVLPVLRRACRRRSDLSVEDTPWVIERSN